MKNYDVILIHPPRTVKSFNSKIAKFARGSYMFIPMGLFAIGDVLEKEGFGVRIINYPLEQNLNHNWAISDYLKNINFNICGIDLHWIHNAYGAIEVARLVKKLNPSAKVILGGYSASYYHNEILKNYKAIDGVIRGEGEIPFLKYIQKINKNQPLDSVPNLSYRDSSKHIKVNSISYTAKTLDDFSFTNISLLKNAKYYFEQSRKIMGISGIIPVGRGCPFNCPFCGGGQRAQQNILGRNKVILRSPERVLEDIRNILENYKVPSIFFGHGTYPANLKYWKRLFGLIQKEKFDIGGDLEIWRLPFPKEMWKIYHETFNHKDSSVSISPRTLSSKVHQKIAKICDPTFKFPQCQINDLIKNANLLRMKLRIWLTIGFPFQKFIDIVKDWNFIIKCILKYGKSNSKPISIMSEPYYIFPGSPAHESPESFGIKLKYNSFLEVAEAFKRSKISYFYSLINYDKEHFSGTSIQNANKLLFLSTIPMLLTTDSKKPKMKDN
ncbi:MAG: cobalamin-dependent protein [Promethearchaeota archaeon]